MLCLFLCWAFLCYVAGWWRLNVLSAWFWWRHLDSGLHSACHGDFRRWGWLRRVLRGVYGVLSHRAVEYYHGSEALRGVGWSKHFWHHVHTNDPQRDPDWSTMTGLAWVRRYPTADWLPCHRWQCWYWLPANCAVEPALELLRVAALCLESLGALLEPPASADPLGARLARCGALWAEVLLNPGFQGVALLFSEEAVAAGARHRAAGAGRGAAGAVPVLGGAALHAGDHFEGLAAGGGTWKEGGERCEEWAVVQLRRTANLRLDWLPLRILDFLVEGCIDAVSFELTMTPLLDDLIHRMRATGHGNLVLSLATDICEAASQRNSRHRERDCGRWEALRFAHPTRLHCEALQAIVKLGGYKRHLRFRSGPEVSELPIDVRPILDNLRATDQPQTMLTHVWRPSIGVRAEDSLRRYHGLLEPIDVAIPTQAPYNTSSAEGGLEPEPGSAAGEEGGDNSISFTQHEVQVVHGDGPSNVLYMHGLDAAQVADMSFQGVSGPPRLANRSDPIGTSRNPPAPATIADAEDTRSWAEFAWRGRVQRMIITAAAASSVLPLAGDLISDRLVCFRRLSQVAFGYRSGWHSWAAAVVREACLEHGVPYHEVGYWEGYARVWQQETLHVEHPHRPQWTLPNSYSGNWTYRNGVDQPPIKKISLSAKTDKLEELYTKVASMVEKIEKARKMALRKGEEANKKAAEKMANAKPENLFAEAVGTIVNQKLQEQGGIEIHSGEVAHTALYNLMEAHMLKQREPHIALDGPLTRLLQWAYPSMRMTPLERQARTPLARLGKTFGPGLQKLIRFNGRLHSEESKDYARSFTPRPSDVFIVTYAKVEPRGFRASPTTSGRTAAWTSTRSLWWCPGTSLRRSAARTWTPSRASRRASSSHTASRSRSRGEAGIQLAAANLAAAPAQQRDVKEAE
ncbi:unnamed protein product [Prorocentrum cordatum]|uniref:Uncharacterized protein n=1 Tax=Prorocentrum cordatum TaxID=2364126 RepID=A0ABN9U421_9DINO|nr:unnamed protein product [Polarella glacialis]